MINMDNYKFDKDHSLVIVNAIVEGYKEYVEHRKDRHRHMKISSAFAWTKGNFIESKIADKCGDIFLYKKAKAGLTWDYLQFIHGDSKKLFLIKNAAYFNDDNFSSAKLPNGGTKGNDHRRTYMHELSKINKEIEFPLAPYAPENKTQNNYEQLSFELADPVKKEQVEKELSEFKSTYNEFHILTYKIDDAYQI